MLPSVGRQVIGDGAVRDNWHMAERGGRVLPEAQSSYNEEVSSNIVKQHWDSWGNLSRANNRELNGHTSGIEIQRRDEVVENQLKSGQTEQHELPSGQYESQMSLSSTESWQPSEMSQNQNVPSECEGHCLKCKLPMLPSGIQHYGNIAADFPASSESRNSAVACGGLEASSLQREHRMITCCPGNEAPVRMQSGCHCGNPGCGSAGAQMLGHVASMEPCAHHPTGQVCMMMPQFVMPGMMQAEMMRQQGMFMPQMMAPKMRESGMLDPGLMTRTVMAPMMISPSVINPDMMSTGALQHGLVDSSMMMQRMMGQRMVVPGMMSPGMMTQGMMLTPETMMMMQETTPNSSGMTMTRVHSTPPGFGSQMMMVPVQRFANPHFLTPQYLTAAPLMTYQPCVPYDQCAAMSGMQSSLLTPDCHSSNGSSP